MSTNDRRNDKISSDILNEGLKMQRAFDQKTAIEFLRAKGIKSEITSAVLAERYDRRNICRRTRA